MATRRDTKQGRFYDIDGESFPSVTTILGCLGKPALVTWAANLERTLVMEAASQLYQDLHGTPRMKPDAFTRTLVSRVGVVKAHQKATDKACEIGSQAHAAIEWAMRKALGQVTPEPKVRPEAMWAYMAFDDWAREHKVKPLRVEQTVWSRTHRYAGTLDLLAEIDGRVALVDFKTSKAIYAEAHLQNAAYQVALSEMGHERAEVGYIVRVPKLETDPAFEVAEVAPVAELFPVFQSVLAVWQWWHAEEVKSLAAWKARRDAVQALAVTA